MDTLQKIKELLSQKYYPFISVSDDYKKSKSVTIHDKDSGAIFEIIEDSVYSFKDHKGNFWLTIPETCIVNKQRFYPVVGDRLTCDKIQYSFTTKEAVIEMATHYFKDFIDPYYGFKAVIHGMYFFENKDDKSDKYFVIFQEFKSRKHDEIKAFISCN